MEPIIPIQECTVKQYPFQVTRHSATEPVLQLDLPYGSMVLKHMEAASGYVMHILEPTEEAIAKLNKDLPEGQSLDNTPPIQLFATGNGKIEVNMTTLNYLDTIIAPSVGVTHLFYTVDLFAVTPE